MQRTQAVPFLTLLQRKNNSSEAAVAPAKAGERGSKLAGLGAEVVSQPLLPPEVCGQDARLEEGPGKIILLCAARGSKGRAVPGDMP